MRIFLSGPTSVVRRLRPPLSPGRKWYSTPSTLPLKPKRDFTKPFSPKDIQDGWYDYWTSRRLFSPSSSSKPPKRMLLPPPNVTGELHIGHALMLSIQDALARYYRMNDYPVHWAPGTDHAGIATQSVVESWLLRERGVTREELGREAFVKEVEAWREKYGRRILEQMKEIGASTDWEKEYYTLDRGLSSAVQNAFVRLFEEGLIYRDTRMVNWSTKLQTAVSDIEVVTQDVGKGSKIDGVEFGVLHNFAFPLVDGDGEIVVSTTRPETIPGDRAVAVHPDDERYKHLHYKLARHPLIPSLTLPIIPDAELVDPKFGSGAVKITPAHDVNDYNFWRRHSTSSTSSFSSSDKKVDIDLVQVFSSAGTMLPECLVPSLVGLDRLHSRKSVVKLLQEANAYRGREDHELRVGVCERSGAIIEPMLVPQWYLRMKPLAEKVLALSEKENLQIIPESPYRQLWEQWLEGIQDWCLSRQIWWGHRIPAFKVLPQDPENPTIIRWIAATSIQDATAKLTTEEISSGCRVQQDEDVLDTWFSSGLLPLTTAGWTGLPEDPGNWKENYPLTFIESGGDILFFWLARMAMLSSWFSNSLPYPEILLHPLVCDGQGKKMSKSVGNVLDPLLVINGATRTEMESKAQAELGSKSPNAKASDIAKTKQTLNQRLNYIKKNHSQGIQQSGADALRMALVDYTRQQRQISMELRHVDVFRRLAIKLDNAFKLWQRAAAGSTTVPASLPKQDELMLHDKYLLHHLRVLIETINKAFENRKLFEATEAFRAFTYDIFCGVYLEFTKPHLSGEASLRVLTFAFNALLKLLHPFMPYQTEGLWQELAPRRDNESIMVAPWPQVEGMVEVGEGETTQMRVVLDLVDELRGRTEQKLGVTLPIDKAVAGYVVENWETIKLLGKKKEAVILAAGDVKKRSGEEGEEGRILIESLES